MLELQNQDRQDAAARQFALEGLNWMSIAERQKADHMQQTRENELDRELERERLEEERRRRAEDRASRETIQRDKDQAAWDRKLADIDSKSRVVGMQEEGRDRRLNTTLDFKGAENEANRQQKQPVFDAEADLKRTRAQFNLSQSDYTQARQKELEGRVQRSIQTEDGVKQMYTDPQTGEYTPDMRAEMMLSYVRNGKPIPPKLLEDTPWKAKAEGRSYAPTTMDERQAFGLAVNNPDFAVRVLAHKRSVTDPADPTGAQKVAQPTQDAMHMATALAVLHNSEEFTPAAGPDYYNDLVKASQKYDRLAEKAAVPGPDGTLSPEAQSVQLAAQNLKMRVEEVKRQRQATLLPDIDRKAKTLAARLPLDKMGPEYAKAWAQLGEQFGITPEEFDEWTNTLKMQSPLFGPPPPTKQQLSEPAGAP